MMDRSIAPALKEITEIAFVKPQVFDLGQYAKLYWMPQVPDETVRIELQFNAGSNRGERAISGTVNSLLFSGSAAKNSRQIHEELDQLGAFLEHEVGLEKAFISVYCLRRNAEAVISLVEEAIRNVEFIPHEIEDVLREKKQSLLVSQEKVGFLARQQFQKRLFSGDGQYGRYASIEDYDQITREQLVAFHDRHYRKGLRRVVVVSNLDESLVNRLVEKFKPWAEITQPEFASKFTPEKGTFEINKPGAIQTAIRMGKLMFNKTHPDYIAFQFVQTIFGDYFGSRLMSNIREDKGYTYGIGCALVEMKQSGYFVIMTEVAKEFAEATQTEIKYEMQRLREELVPEEELELVRNYMLGQMLKSADGPNAMMDLYLGAEQHHMDFDFYNQYMTEIRQMTSNRVREMANRYLNWEDFTVILAG